MIESKDKPSELDRSLSGEMEQLLLRTVESFAEVATAGLKRLHSSHVHTCEKNELIEVIDAALAMANAAWKRTSAYDSTGYEDPF